jgi:hypothetical protein
MDLFHDLFRFDSHSHNFTVRHSHTHEDVRSHSNGNHHHHRSDSKWTTVSTVFLLIALCIVALWIFLMNSIVIYGILKKPKQERCETDYYYMNLSAIDVLDGCLTLPIMGLTLIHGDFLVGYWWCHVWIFLDYSLIIGSSIGLMCLT